MNEYVLGISCYFHDSAACLVKNGKVISSVQEERFTGIKMIPLFLIEALNGV